MNGIFGELSRTHSPLASRIPFWDPPRAPHSACTRDINLNYTIRITNNIVCVVCFVEWLLVVCFVYSIHGDIVDKCPYAARQDRTPGVERYKGTTLVCARSNITVD